MKKKLIEKHKKEIIIATLITIAVLVGVIGTTYAMFIAKDESGEQTMYKVGDLNVVFNDNGDKINMKDEYPMTDEAGLKTTPHTFTITNNGDYNVTYTIQIENIKTGLNPTHIKYAINASTPTLLSTETTSIDIGTLTPKEKKTFELRLWVDEKTDETQATYEGQIKANGQAVRIPYFKDTSGANKPEIEDTGLIPVVYDGVNDEWMVADQEKGWYAYQDQVWANAVTVSDTAVEYRSAKAGTIIPMDAINSMWVWIPRYKYQIPSDVGSTKAVTTPPQIDVVFEKDTETTGLYNDIAEYGYYTHPAFRDGNNAELLTKEQVSDGGHTGWDKELKGIWVGKFETSTDNEECNNAPWKSRIGPCEDVNPIIKPSVKSLDFQDVSTQFKTSLKFAGGTMNDDTGDVEFIGSYKYGIPNTVDTHMMKSTEWGAIAYLSQSKYGKNGNNNYKDADKEIYINNAYDWDLEIYYTGRSSGMVNDGHTPFGSYSYNGKVCNTETLECTGEKTEESIIKGVGASTTGTIYGIYDMGRVASYEVVMGAHGDLYTRDYDGFTVLPNQKYWDKYTGKTGYDFTSNSAIKGDATYEIMNWYSIEENYYLFFNGTFWLMNSIYNKFGFLFDSSFGDPSPYYFRSTLIP